MKKIFISQPMKDKADEVILAEREKAIEIAKNHLGEDVEVIDSFFQGAPHDAKPLWFLGNAIELMSDADVVVFASGWQNARGCKIEHTCAVEYGIKIIKVCENKIIENKKTLGEGVLKNTTALIVETDEDLPKIIATITADYISPAEGYRVRLRPNENKVQE